MKVSDLKDVPLPCPFCGDEAALYADDALAAPYWCECMSCGIRTDFFHGPGYAVDHWNRRDAMTDDELDAAFWREKTYEYRDMRAELKRLVTEWRDKEATNRRAVFAIGEHFAAADTYERCADDLEAVLRRTVAAELTRMAQEDGEHDV